MNKAVISEWITQLRYGNYTKVKYALKQDVIGGGVGFCANGVLCDMAERIGILDPAVRMERDIYYRWGSDAALLPVEVREWAGLPKHIESRVRKMNDDGEGWNVIANYLERELKA